MDQVRLVYDFFSKNRIQVIRISNFTYAKACNMGAQRAKGIYMVYLSAHSFPISNTWLEDGLSNINDGLVAGVFAYPTMGSEATILEKIVFSKVNKRRKGGNLGNTNSIIRKDLWLKHNFDESLMYSEDLEWSIFWKRKGYEIINDPRFSVYHSHHLGLLGIIKQKITWEKSKKVINKKFKN